MLFISTMLDFPFLTTENTEYTEIGALERWSIGAPVPQRPSAPSVVNESRCVTGHLPLI